MIIKSPFKDYYDYISHIYGQDDKVKYIRNTLYTRFMQEFGLDATVHGITPRGHIPAESRLVYDYSIQEFWSLVEGLKDYGGKIMPFLSSFERV